MAQYHAGGCARPQYTSTELHAAVAPDALQWHARRGSGRRGAYQTLRLWPHQLPDERGTGYQCRTLRLTGPRRVRIELMLRHEGNSYGTTELAGPPAAVV